MCETCGGLEATCVPVIDSADPDTCAAPRVCGANAACLLPDQVQPEAIASTPLATVGISRFAQIVLPGRTGLLRELLLALFCNPGTISLELQGVTMGQPNGAVAYRVAGIVPDLSQTRLVIEPPVPVQAGVPFAMVFSGNSGEVCAVNVVGIDAYPRGDAFIEAPQAPGEWSPFSGDMSFETRIAE